LADDSAIQNTGLERDKIEDDQIRSGRVGGKGESAMH
jgi:hypothetical protein